MGLVRAILDGSKIVQEERDLAAADGLAKGQAAAARKFLRLLLNKHFPDLTSLSQIDAISDPKALDSLIESAMETSSQDSIRAAILAAAKPN